MSSQNPLHSRLLIVGGCLVLGVLYALSASVDLNTHHDYLRNIQSIEMLDTRLNKEVLRLRYGLVSHYDGVVKDLDAIEQIGGRLLDPPAFVGASRRDELKIAARDFRATMDDKAALVEQFKSTNAGLRGSLVYFPVAMRQLIEISRPIVADRAQAVLAAVLEYEISNSPSNREQAIAATTSLEAIQSTAVPREAPHLDAALSHAHNVLSRGADLDVLIKQIDQSESQSRLSLLRDRYKEAYVAAHQRAERYRWLLFLLAALTVGGTVHTLRALSRTKIKLQQINANLDQRVLERTEELATAKKLLERDAKILLELNEELEDSNRELDDFAYIASHDLKEPLRGIHNYAAFLIEDYSDKLDETGQQKLRTLSRLAKRMDGLIETLLHFSRVGRTELACGTNSIEEIVEDVVDSLHISLQERGVEVRIPDPLPSVYCDKVRVTEVFRNLVSNALKYNDKPNPWIEIGCQPATDESDPEKAQKTYYVRDNGIGIREKHNESIFRIFKRLHGRDKFGGGTGAGLTIVKKIVERHGGKVWIESEYGEGTTFFFELGGKERA